MSNSNKGNTGAGRKRRSIQANLLAVINSVAVITALLSTCHFIFVPSMQPQQDPFSKKENPIQKLLNKRRGKNNGTELASVASIIEDTTADSEQPAFDFGDDDDDDDGMFSNRKTNETKSFWESLKENLGRKEKAEGEEKTPTSGLRKSAKAPP